MWTELGDTVSVPAIQCCCVTLVNCRRAGTMHAHRMFLRSSRGRALQTAVWEPPPWAEAPDTAAGRHALAERSEPPTWELQQQPDSRERPAEQGAGDQAETAKPAKARKAAKAKVSHAMLVPDRISPASPLPMTLVEKTSRYLSTLGSCLLPA